MRRALLLLLALSTTAHAQALLPLQQPTSCAYFDDGRFCSTSAFWLFPGGIGTYVPGSGAALSMFNYRTGQTISLSDSVRTTNETCQNSSGQLVTLTSGQPCVVNAPGVGGYRPEPTSTNLNPNCCSAAAWTLTNATQVSNGSGDPYGTSTAITITATATTGEHKVSFFPTVVTTNSYTSSFYVPTGSGNYVSIYDSANTTTTYCEFNTSNETVQATGGTNYSCAVDTIAQPPGWTRYIASVKSYSSTTPTIFIVMGDTAAHAVPGTSWTAVGTETMKPWGVQFESPTLGCASGSGKFCPASGLVFTNGATQQRLLDELLGNLPASVFPSSSSFSFRDDLTLEMPALYYAPVNNTIIVFTSLCGSGSADTADYLNAGSQIKTGGRDDTNTVWGPQNGVIGTFSAGDTISGRYFLSVPDNTVNSYLYQNGSFLGIGTPITATTNTMSNMNKFYIGWNCGPTALNPSPGGIVHHDVAISGTNTGAL